MLRQTFEELRTGLNGSTVDLFMWENFVSQQYYDSREIEKIKGNLHALPSWQIVAPRHSLKLVMARKRLG